MHRVLARWSTPTWNAPPNGAITYAACHWQNDPHVMRNCASSLEEFRHDRTSRRDDIILGFVKHQSRYVKRAPTHDCYQLYVQHFQPVHDA